MMVGSTFRGTPPCTPSEHISTTTHATIAPPATSTCASGASPNATGKPCGLLIVGRGAAHSPHDARQFATIDLDGAERHGSGSPEYRQVVMREAARLEPLGPAAYRLRHSVQLVETIGDHMTHSHAPERVLRGADIHGH